MSDRPQDHDDDPAPGGEEPSRRPRRRLVRRFGQRAWLTPAVAVGAVLAALLVLRLIGTPSDHAALDRHLVAAVSAGDSATVRELLERGANPDALDGTGRPALLCTALAPVTLSLVGMPANGGPCQSVVKHKGYHETVTALLAHGARVDVVDADGAGALSLAAQEDDGDLWRQLKAKGATR